MNHMEPDGQEEKPLDPAMETVRRKMVRLLLVSTGTMLIGFMAVFGAIVYKTSHSDTTPKAQEDDFPAEMDMPSKLAALLPAGFEVKAVALSRKRILFYGETANGKRMAYVFDMTTGRMAVEVALIDR